MGNETERYNATVSGVLLIGIGLVVLAMSPRAGARNERWVASNRFARQTTLLRGRSLRLAGTTMFALFGTAFVVAGIAVLAHPG